MSALDPRSAPGPTDPGAYYRSREAGAEEAARHLDHRVARTTRWRLASFTATVVAFALVEFAPEDLRAAVIVAGAVAALVFFGFVRRHSGLRKDRDRERLRATLSREAQARLRREWNALPAPPVLRPCEEHPNATDLDLVGRASLSHLLGRVTTAQGRSILEHLILDPFRPLPADGLELLSWLRSDPAPPAPAPSPMWIEEVRLRREAVEALRPQLELREWLELLGRETPRGGLSRDTVVFLEWLAQPRWLSGRRSLVWAGRILAVFTPVTLGTWLAGWTPGILPVLGALCALALHRAIYPRASGWFSAAEAGEGDLASWASQLQIAARLPEGGARLGEIRRQVSEPAPGAYQAIRRLGRIVDTAAVRRSSLAHFPLVVLLAWDVHLLERLERWHAKHAEAAGRWVRALGELEVLAALGGLLHDHPDWTFPEFSSDATEGIRGTSVGHPLLDPAECVRNDVEVPGPGRLLLVTGSNMAGKTTLLRAIGVNQVLALAGAPVSARAFRTRPLLPWCAMRVRDSLESGVSYFLAELQRLKRVVEAAQGTATLYLLDEILQGTNSEERRTAARIVLAQLLGTGSVGAITTHDLTLAATEELGRQSIDVHFREEVIQEDGKQALRFDYLLRPGPATSRNALLLLEIVGLRPQNPRGPER